MLAPSQIVLDWFEGTDSRLRDALAIRFQVFVDEQGIPAELEIDDLDGIAWHAVAWADDVPIGTARLVSKDATHVKVGRVAVLPSHRRQGVATRLIELLLELARRQGFQQAELASQIEAMPVYEKLGFVAHGPYFLDAGLPHRLMRRTITHLG